jgi:hypothetical protein
MATSIDKDGPIKSVAQANGDDLRFPVVLHLVSPVTQTLLLAQSSATRQRKFTTKSSKEALRGQ